MLAVIKQQKHSPIADEPQDRLDDWDRPGWSGSPSVRATVTGTTMGSATGARSTHHMPSVELVGQSACHLDRKAGLAGAACSGQRHKTVVGEQAADLTELTGASDESR